MLGSCLIFARVLFNFWLGCLTFSPGTCLLLARVLFTLGFVALHLAQVCLLWLGTCLLLARVLFTFGLVAIHVAKVLFTLVRDLFTFG